jgi:hypothetical protein
MTDETQPVKGTPHPDPTPEPDTHAAADEPTTPVEEKQPGRLARLRSRAGTIRGATVAVALAGVIVGGAAGFAAGALTTGADNPGHGPGQLGRPFDQDGDDDGLRPDGAPGQLPPSTAPEEDLSNS